ncbi:polysaccharide deacetylase family protein [Rariglobus hedericola]|uniref:Polysaccharide deacetylase family protein n=1 Tax=Rariglobus hedericola TaxID=2597822 RepID=A0A556QSP9_9BACT|nr:polysaccharide deacetylase family protein [Rariglobus hedericola]TSJ79661.1 polysaccharide deacetylase family protein [Rariglobus hedericola]
MSLKLPVFFAALFLGAQVFAATGKSPLSLSPEGVVIDNGVDAPITLKYPLVMNEARKEAKVSAATVTGATAVVNYEGGGQVGVKLADGSVTFDLAAMPAGTKHLHAVMNIGAEYTGVGKWQVGTGAVTLFPQDKPASPFLHKGGATEFSLFGPTGARTTVHVPVFCYQQVNDNREWNNNIFQWHVFLPVTPDASTLTLQIEITAATVTGVPAASTPAAVTVAQPSLKTPAPPEETITGTRVLKWKDGKRAVFMIQFDDSASSQLRNVIPELTKRSIPGTFYINPGNGPYKAFQAQWEKVANLPGIELANHTFTHNGALTPEIFDEEIVKTNEVLNQLYPDRKTPRLISFGRPGVAKEKWGITEEQIKAVLAKNHMIERPPFTGPPFQYKTIPEMNQLVDLAIKSGEMKSLVFHGVGGDWLVTPMDYFNAVLDKLDANRDQLWLTDPLAYHKYLTARTTAVAKEVSSTPKRIQISLTTQADPALYDLPLSLATRVPADWAKAAVQQGSSRVTVPVVAGVARYNAFPGSAEIVLTPTS